MAVQHISALVTCEAAIGRAIKLFAMEAAHDGIGKNAPLPGYIVRGQNVWVTHGAARVGAVVSSVRRKHYYYCYCCSGWE